MEKPSFLKKLSLDQLVKGKDYYIIKNHSIKPFKAAGIYVGTEEVGHSVGRGDNIANLLIFRNIINVKYGTPHESYRRGVSVKFFENDITVYKKLLPRLEEMDSHNMDRMRENYLRLQGVAGLASNVSQGDIERFKKPIKKVEKVKELLLYFDFDEGPWQKAQWDNDNKVYIVPDESDGSLSETKGGFSRKNKKGKKKGGFSRKNKKGKKKGKVFL
jgi:hypothetical protein